MRGNLWYNRLSGQTRIAPEKRNHRRLFVPSGDYRERCNTMKMLPFNILIDDIDTDLLHHRWGKVTKHDGYLRCRVKGNLVLMHRIIVERMIGRSLIDSEMVDHINGDTFDNRRANLRVVSPMQNTWNAGKSKRNKSGVKGVHFYKETGKWRAMIGINGKNTHIGCYDTIEEAREAYQQKAIELRGEYVRNE